MRTKLDQRVVERLTELVAEAEEVVTARHAETHSGIGTFHFVDRGRATELFVKGQNILGRVFGKDSDHYQRFLETTKRNMNNLEYGVKAAAILKAALSDYEHGYLFDVKQLIHAEVLDDLLDQAQVLLDAGYFGPAAVVAGTVLENALRRMCNGVPSITLPEKPKLDWMNAELAKAGTYNKLVQKQITAQADLRNKAAHGHWQEFTNADVDDMLRYVRRFAADHLV